MIAIITIWILAAVALGLAGIAARAYLLERREGLPRSGLRLGVTAGVALAVIALGVVVQLGHRPPATPSTSDAPHASADPAKLAALRGEIDKLEGQLDAKRAELEKLDPSAKAVAPSLDAAPPAWPLLVALALVLVGFGALTFGDLSTLLPRRRAASTPDAPPADDETAIEVADLPALHAHVAAGRWKAGARVAAKIAAETLHKLEVLDLLFLGAYCNVFAVAAPEDGKALSTSEKTERLASATKDLGRLLDLAPHMAEARWLAGYAAAQAGEWQSGLDQMRAARPELKVDRAFDRDDSVCLLRLAEAKLAAADGDGATQLFDEVARLGVLAGQIPVAMVTHRLLTVRADIKAQKFTEAEASIARIREVTGLEDSTQRSAGIACDVYSVAISLGAGEHQRALAQVEDLFGRWLPPNLPDVEDQAADEFLLPAIDVKDLALPARLIRALWFVAAVARVELGARRGAPLADPEVDAIATSLLRALQFEPRHRESLAALAAHYLAYRKDRTEKAIAWLDAALTMGVRSQRARTLLSETRRVERERKELLAMFRSASAQYLADPAVATAVREALIEELGRFEEFRPVVLDLHATGALDTAAGPASVEALRERASFVNGVALEVVARSEPTAARELAELHRELSSLISNVDTSATRIATLERAVMERLGRIVLR